MNKKNLSILLFLALAGSAYAQNESEMGKLQFGVRAGCAVNTIQLIATRDDGRDIISFDGVGWQVGGSAYYNIRNVQGISGQDYWGVEASLFLSNRMYFTGDILNSLYYMELPVTVAYIMPLTGKLKSRLQLGPYVGLGLAGSNSAFTENLRRFNFGLTGGIGMDVGRFFVGASYNFGMFNVARNLPSRLRQVINSANLVVGWNF
jgi:hypothetical protein